MRLQKKPISASEMQEIKQKTSKIMKDYELQMIEKEFQKQKLKQNVMLEIMSNRQKKQSHSQSTSKQTTSQGQRTARQNQLNNFPIKKVVDSRIMENNSPSDRVADRLDQKEGIQTLLRKSYTLPNDDKQLRISLVSQRKQQQYLQQSNDLGQITFNHKNSALNIPKIPILTQLPKNSAEESDHLEINQHKQAKWVKTSKESDSRENRSSRNINKKEQFPTFRDSKKRIILNEDQLYRDHNHEQKYSEDNRQESPQAKQTQQDDYQKHGQSQNRRQQSQCNNFMDQSAELPQQRDFEHTYEKGVFLTVEQNQSQFTQANKNCAFDILMDKSDPNQNLDQLKKKKLFQLQKKRAARMEQFKRQQDAKKDRSESAVQKTKYRQIHGQKKSQKNLHQDDENDTVRSNTNVNNNQDKSKKAIKTNDKPPRNTSSFNYVEHSAVSKQQNVNPPSVRRNRQQQQNERKNSFGNTPKTISTTKNKDKRSNIFAQSPSGGRDKSASKYNNDPKIEPKTIKNGFNRQSNKKLMITAITYVCLPGQLNRKHRQELIQVLQNESSSDYFIFLFKEYSRKVIKGIYILDIQEDRIRKIYGEKAPSELYSDQIHSFYRFDSGSREFKGIDGCKSFSLAVNAVDLK